MHTNLAINAMFNRAKKIERGEVAFESIEFTAV